MSQHAEPPVWADLLLQSDCVVAITLAMQSALGDELQQADVDQCAVNVTPVITYAFVMLACILARVQCYMCHALTQHGIVYFKPQRGNRRSVTTFGIRVYPRPS